MAWSGIGKPGASELGLEIPIKPGVDLLTTSDNGPQSYLFFVRVMSYVLRYLKSGPGTRAPEQLRCLINYSIL